jgi:hypothetical protein
MEAVVNIDTIHVDAYINKVYINNMEEKSIFENIFEKEQAYYKAHKDEFREKYLNKWLIIVGDSLYGVYDTIPEAVKNATKQYKPGEFMLHRPADDDRLIKIGPHIRYEGHNKIKEQNTEATMIVSEGPPVRFTYA